MRGLVLRLVHIEPGVGQVCMCVCMYGGSRRC